MKKFGFSSSKKSKGSPAPENPYAQAQPNDPYTAEDTQKYANVAPSYREARSGLPPPGAGGLPSGPRGAYGAALNRHDSSGASASAPPPYQPQPAAQPAAGYNSNKYGTSSGYGSSKYGSSSAGESASGARSGGYGGLGPTADDDAANREALLAGARQRDEAPQASSGSGDYGQSGGDSASKYGGYGEQRDLTEEEKDTEAYRDAKAQIHETTKASLATNQNSMRYMNQAIDTGLQTYARLGAQNERLHHTDQLLDTATESHRHAEAQTKKLKSLNRSMFAVHVNNPFTAKRRTAEEEARVMTQSQLDRQQREATRRDKFGQNARMEQTFASFDKDQGSSSFTRANRGDRSKYTLEDDSDEEGAKELDEQNEQIERDLEQMSVGVGKLKRIGQAMGEELDHSNKLIDRIGEKTDPLDDQIRVTNARMNRIR
ncbi:Uu.00g039720.m01.CDS01 [Anthostomella pinea]|uniref:Uu.00g039720.m01.CDS01 n=1 Tax=Anthostomella pinea TaxID=933095 RepID=A0AAI8YBG3_9PEZI|nr:Uu.00g039720.m01.CDS01 [Anthostomella pinea]